MANLLGKSPTIWPLLALLVLLPGLALGKDQPQLLITGNVDEAVESNIRTLVDLGRYPCLPPAAQYGLIRRQILSNSTQALQAMGYYQASLSLSAENGGDCFQVTLQVETGAPVLLTQVDIRVSGDASLDPAFSTIQERAQQGLNLPLHHDIYSELKKSLQQRLIGRGYVEGKLTTHELRVDTETRQASIHLHVESGPRYRVGAVTMTGSDLKPTLLQGYLNIHEGDPFNRDQLLSTQQALLGAGYFSAVRIQKDTPDSETRTIPISITLSDSNRWSLLTGIGASTDTGPRVRLGVENRRVNRAGHRFRAETELSKVQQGAGASYQIPLKDPQNERLDLHTSYINEDTDSNENERWSTGADYIVQLNNKWVSTTSLEYLRETYQVADQVDQAELIIPAFQLARIKANDPIYPTRGWRLGGKISFANRNLSSTASFLQVTSGAKTLFPVLGGRVLLRADLGYTEVVDVMELPASLRFFAGGDSSIRGFAYQSLGPKDDNDEVIGGRDIATASVELDHPVTEKWHLAVFSDAGNAFNDIEDFDPRHSAGFGVRWLSPLGPIRLDLARAIDEHRDWRVHLSMGPDL